MGWLIGDSREALVKYGMPKTAGVTPDLKGTTGPERISHAPSVRQK